MKIKLNQWIFLLAISMLFFSPTVLSMALPVTPSIRVTDAIYGVNDHGDTTIHLTGKLTSVSVDTCQFRLEIPEEFEVDTLIDGSPIMNLVDNGSAQQIALKETELEIVFILQTFDTTLLPKSYNLEVNSTKLQYSGKITPHWAEDSGGERSNPYITDFLASDSEKGETTRVRTWIYNPTGFPKYLSFLKYDITAYDYDTWHDWTLPYYENKYIWDGYILMVQDWLACIFADHANEDKYALNKGDYDITSIYAYGSGWCDYDYPTSGNNFDVEDPSSGMNMVFVAHLVDQSFRNTFVENSYFNDLENVEFKIAGEGDHTLKDDFDIDFMSLVLSWTPGSTNIDTLFDNSYNDAKNALGLSDDWDHLQGTRSNNHGFDLLFCHSWELNTLFGYGAGIANHPGNNALVMKGFYPNGVEEKPEYIDCDLVSLHETLHTFDCYTSEAGHCPYSGYIMHENDCDYNMHSNTEGTLLDNIDQYDGL